MAGNKRLSKPSEHPSEAGERLSGPGEGLNTLGERRREPARVGPGMARDCFAPAAILPTAATASASRSSAGARPSRPSPSATAAGYMPTSTAAPTSPWNLTGIRGSSSYGRRVFDMLHARRAIRAGQRRVPRRSVPWRRSDRRRCSTATGRIEAMAQEEKNWDVRRWRSWRSPR